MAEKQAKHYYKDMDKQYIEAPEWYQELIPESRRVAGASVYSAKPHSTSPVSPRIESRSPPTTAEQEWGFSQQQPQPQQ